MAELTLEMSISDTGYRCLQPNDCRKALPKPSELCAGLGGAGLRAGLGGATTSTSIFPISRCVTGRASRGVARAGHCGDASPGRARGGVAGRVSRAVCPSARSASSARRAPLSTQDIARLNASNTLSAASVARGPAGVEASGALKARQARATEAAESVFDALSRAMSWVESARRAPL